MRGSAIPETRVRWPPPQGRVHVRVTGRPGQRVCDGRVREVQRQAQGVSPGQPLRCRKRSIVV